MWILILEILEHNLHDVFLSTDFSKIIPDQIVVILVGKKTDISIQSVFFIYAHTEHK